MEKVKYLILVLALGLSGLAAEAATTLVWTFSGVESTQNNQVLADYPVLLREGSADGLWVLNSTAGAYVKSESSLGFSGKVLRIGSANISPVGTSISLSGSANPIPASATITEVKVTLKSLLSESGWQLSLGDATSAVMTAPELTAMDDYATLTFSGLNFTGNTPRLTCTSLAKSGKYVYIASVSVTYEGGVSQSAVADPAFTLSSGSSIVAGTEIGITCATPDATVYASVGDAPFAAVENRIVAVTGTIGLTVTVRAYAAKGGMADSKVVSASYNIIAPATEPPYTESFDNASALNAFTIIDTGADGTTWKYNSAEAAALIEHTLGSKAKDDWLITPPLALFGGRTYVLRFDARCANASYPEMLGVSLGSAATAKGMTTELIAPQTIDTTGYKTFEASITPDTDGIYFVGFHACSAQGMYRLFLDNIRISAGTVATAPDTVENLTIVNDYNGATQAEIKFTTPATTVGGTMLSEISRAIVYRNGQEVKTFANPAIGTEISYIDTPEAPGLYTYSFVCKNSAGSGRELEQQAYVGINIPSNPTQVGLFGDFDHMHVLWDEPTTTIYGDAINPELISYTIYDIENNIVAENYTRSELIVSSPEQVLQKYTVKAATSAGRNDVNPAESEVFILGAPYRMPYTESFTKWHAQHLVEYEHGNYNGRWRIVRQDLTTGIHPYDADEGFMSFEPQAVGESASFKSGYIMTSGENPMLSFRLYNIAGSTNTVKITVEYPDKSEEIIIKPNWTGWKEQLVELAESIIRLRFTATAGSTAVSTAIDNICVINIKDTALKINRFRLPIEMEPQSSHSAFVEIENDGLNTVDFYRIKLLHNGEVIQETAGGYLERGDVQVFDFDIVPDKDGLSNYQVIATIDDEIYAEATETTEVRRPVFGRPTNLSANGAILTWKAPTYADNDTPVTETFERYDEFGIDTAGEWKFADLDKGLTYGINDGVHSFPNMASEMAYIVMNQNIATLDTIGSMTFDAHSGAQYLASFAVQGGEIANNDWLISPRLNGKQQTVSFFARSMSIACHEKFEFRYSFTDNATSSFYSIGEDENSTAEWTEYSYTLPAGANYFAIRCVSLDQYAFFIDDITYTPAPEQLDKLLGYNVYIIDDKLSDPEIRLNATPITDTSFTITDVPMGKHTYNVRAVYPGGESDPISIETTVSGIDSISILEDVPVKVYSTTGILVASGTKDVISTLSPGVYIIVLPDTSTKIVIK